MKLGKSSDREQQAHELASRLYHMAGDLRRLGRYKEAARVDKIADDIYPGDIKPAPIVPRTVSG